MKLIPNLVYSSKLLAKEKPVTTSNCSIPSTQSSDDGSMFSKERDSYKSVKDLSNEDVQALEHIYLLICHLVHLDVQFLNQFCDAVVVFNMCEMLQKLLHLGKFRLREQLRYIKLVMLCNFGENGFVLTRF